MQQTATNYDPLILFKYSQTLYERANRMIASYTILGVLLGGLVGALSGVAIGNGGGYAVTGFLVLGMIFGALGGVLGSARAFMLKLEAQRLMCWLQIEINTWPNRGHQPYPVPPGSR